MESATGAATGTADAQAPQKHPYSMVFDYQVMNGTVSAERLAYLEQQLMPSSAAVIRQLIQVLCNLLVMLFTHVTS
jgi:hypothetical protein